MIAACGGSESTGPEDNPVPVLESVSPDVIESGSPATILVVSGRSFVAGATARVSGADRPTDLLGPTRLRTTVEAIELATSRTLSVTVVNPGPGGGQSTPLSVQVVSPAPVVGDVVPAHMQAGSEATTLIVLGRFFRPNSVVRWNGSDRPTEYVSTERLEVWVNAADLATPQRARLGVHTPGGGYSEREYVVHNPQPGIGGISPGHATVGADGLRLDVYGVSFVPGAVVRWNGAPRPTSFISSEWLSAAIATADLADAGPVEVSVANPDPTLELSNTETFWVHPAGRFVLARHASDLAWDPVRGRLYASLRETDPDYPGDIVALDPASGHVMERLHVGLSPGSLAISDDASMLYVALDGEGAVARVDLSTFTLDLRFVLGAGEFGTMYVDDIHVMPGAPRTVAVSRMNLDVRPRHEGVAVYDDGVMRPVALPRNVGGNRIEFASPTLLYGLVDESSDFSVFRMEVGESGIAVLGRQEGLVHAFGADMRYGDGHIFFTTGTVADAESMWLTATLNVAGLVAPEPTGGRVYYLSEGTLHAASTTTWTMVGAESLEGVPGAWRGLTRWGADGLAFVAVWHVVILRSALVHG